MSMEIPAGKWCGECGFFVKGPDDPYAGCDCCGIWQDESLKWDETGKDYVRVPSCAAYPNGAVIEIKPK